MALAETFMKLTLIFLLSALYGLERQRSHKPAGFGTFTLVAVGSGALSIVALDLDLSRSISIIGGIITGVGFLGAGALIRNNDKVFGFTTAASIWVFAILGMMIGLGYYLNGFLIYAIVWVAVLIDSYLEGRGIRSYRKRLTLVYSGFHKKEDISNILAEYSDSFSLSSISVNRKDKTVTSSYLMEGFKKEIGNLLSEFHDKSWCISVKLE